MSRAILLFGGTFDPVHHGHLIVARAAAERGSFDRVTFVPTARPPHKPAPVASGEDRLAMLRLAVEGEPLLEVCDGEIRRGGTSYTIDTLRELRRQWGTDVELRWAVGVDMLSDLPTWHRVGELLELTRLVVLLRPPWSQRLAAILDGLRGRLPDGAIEQLARSVLPAPQIEVSSSEIRGRVAEGRSIRFLVPETVRTYIEKRGLYRGVPAPEKNAENRPCCP